MPPMKNPFAVSINSFAEFLIDVGLVAAATKVRTSAFENALKFCYGILFPIIKTKIDSFLTKIIT